MPQLLLFAPCERVIVEQGSAAVSMISIFQDLGFGVESPDPTAVAPIRWYVLAIWCQIENDKATRFEQRVILQGPTGQIFVEMMADFEMTKRYHRIVGQVGNFPIGQQGVYSLKLQLRTVGETDWKDMATYPMRVEHGLETPVAQPETE